MFLLIFSTVCLIVCLMLTIFFAKKADYTGHPLGVALILWGCCLFCLFMTFVSAYNSIVAIRILTS